jgi:hypothetical protein
VHQDGWLLQTEARDYGKTRRWGNWLYKEVGWAQGFVWPSRQDIGGRSLLVFGDRAMESLVEVPGSGRDLDDPDGMRWLDDRLRPFGLEVLPPPPGGSPPG